MKKPRGKRTPKGYTPGNLNKNLAIAGHGKVSGEAAHFFHMCMEFKELTQMTVKCGESENLVKINAYDDRSRTPFGHHATNSDDMPKELGELVVYNMLCAIEKKDGKFFRELADICENGFQWYPLHHWLIVVHFQLSKGWGGVRNQDCIYDSKELLVMAEKYERNSGEVLLSGTWIAKEKAIRRACRELGIKLKQLKKPKSK